MVLEDGGMDLHSFFRKQIRPLDIEHIRHISRQICSAVAYLHSCRVLHRDLKPANILIDGDPDSPTYLHVRVADFGLSRAVELPAGTSAENVMSVIMRAVIRKSPSDDNLAQSGALVDEVSCPDDGLGSFESTGAALLVRKMTSWVVTRAYRAPEVILCNGNYSQVHMRHMMREPLLIRCSPTPPLRPRPFDVFS